MKQTVADPDEPACYTTKQLQKRYGGAAKSTIYRNIREKGFPPGDRFGNRNLYSIQAVHAWERIHMPHLHPGESGPAGEFEVLASDENKWAQFRTERQLQSLREQRRQRTKKRPPFKPSRPPA